MTFITMMKMYTYFERMTKPVHEKFLYEDS